VKETEGGKVRSGHNINKERTWEKREKRTLPLIVNRYHLKSLGEAEKALRKEIMDKEC